MAAYATLAGVRFDRLFTEFDAIAEAYEKGLPMARKLFGADISYGGPTWAGNSYNHVNALGAPLTFPEDSEVGAKPIYGSLQEGIRALQKKVDFLSVGIMPTYLELWQTLNATYPEHKAPFQAKAEGPITTAWLLRGHDFFADLLEYPDQAQEYLRLVTQSVIAFIKAVRSFNGQPRVGSAAGLVDDVAAMIAPSRWPELVLPYLQDYYSRLSTEGRAAHIEDLRVEHLPYLDTLSLDSYDPSLSPWLTPALIRDHCSVPFSWRLNSTHYPGRTPRDIEQWVYESAADGASSVHTIIWREMCSPEVAEMVRAFIHAGREAQDFVAEGGERGALRERLNLR